MQKYRTWVLSVVRVGNIANFQFQWYVMRAFDFPVAECIADGLGLLWRAVAQNPTVQLYGHTCVKSGG